MKEGSIQSPLYTFQLAKKEESTLLSTLFKTVYIQTYGTEGVTHEFSDFIEQQFSPDKIRRDIDDGNGSLWVAKYKNNPVGIIQIEYDKTCPVNSIVAPEINKLYVLRNFYGKGIGRKLMQLAEGEISDHGNNNVWLWVLDSNQRAIEFYGKQGYQKIGKAQFQMTENLYCNTVMIKSLQTANL